VEWTIRAEPTDLFFYSVACGEHQCVAVGMTGHVLTSPDGMSWRAATADTTAYLSGVIFAEGQFVSVGTGGTIVTSIDGLAWTPSTLGLSGIIMNAVTFGNGQFVAVGTRGTILNSPDGLAWTKHDLKVSFSLGDIVYGNGRFVAIGPRLSPVRSGGTFVSLDGVNWSQTWTNNVNAIGFNDGEFMAVADGFYTSADASNWVQRTSTRIDAWTIARGNGVYVGTASSLGYISTSTNGVDWARNSITSQTLTRVRFHDVRVIAVGPGIFTSSNGLSWDWIDAQAGYPSGIAFGPGVQVVTTGAPYDRPIGPGSLSSSLDGTNWVRNIVLPGNSLLGVAYGNGRFVAVGSETILFSELLRQPQAGRIQLEIVSGQARISLIASPGETHDVEASNDLTSWTSIGSLVLTNSTGEIVDPVPTVDHRFYRGRRRN
jgi:hypothetical protein